MNITPKAAKFLTYWRRYEGTDIMHVAIAARRAASEDGRDTVCLNDVEAAFIRLIGPLWADWA